MCLLNIIYVNNILKGGGNLSENINFDNSNNELNSADTNITQTKICGCAEKHTVRTEEEKKKLQNRLNRIEGQIRGIRSMLEKDAYCNDILVQSAAVGAAINAFNKELLSNHIHNCVVRDIKDGKEEVVDEMLKTIHKLMK